MSDCFLNHFPGREILLRFLPPDEQTEDIQWAADILAAIDELQTVVKPLSADIVIGCRDLNISLLDDAVKPPIPHWQIRTSTLPKDVIIKPGLVNSQISEVPELSTTIMMEWIQKALQQECPCSETHKTCWNAIYIDATKARICEEATLEIRQSFWLESDRGKFEFPLEDCEDGLWVYGPILDLLTEPPFTLRLTNDEGALKINMSIHWSLWTQPGSASYITLREAVLRIVNKGWELTDPTRLFKM